MEHVQNLLKIEEGGGGCWSECNRKDGTMEFV